MFRRLLPVEPAHTPDLAWKFNSCEQKCSLILHKCQSNIRRGNKVLDWYNFARPALWRKRLNWKLTIAAIAHFGAWWKLPTVQRKWANWASADGSIQFNIDVGSRLAGRGWKVRGGCQLHEESQTQPTRPVPSTNSPALSSSSYILSWVKIFNIIS